MLSFKIVLMAWPSTSNDPQEHDTILPFFLTFSSVLLHSKTVQLFLAVSRTFFFFKNFQLLPWTSIKTIRDKRLQAEILQHMFFLKKLKKKVFFICKRSFPVVFSQQSTGTCFFLLRDETIYYWRWKSFSPLRATTNSRKFSRKINELSFKNLFFITFSSLQLHRFLVQHAVRQWITIRRKIIIVISVKFTCAKHTISEWKHRKSNRSEWKVKLHVQCLADGEWLEYLGSGKSRVKQRIKTVFKTIPQWNYF